MLDAPATCTSHVNVVAIAVPNGHPHVTGLRQELARMFPLGHLSNW